MLQNVSRNQDYGSLLLNRSDHHEPPGMSYINGSPYCCSAGSATGHQGKWKMSPACFLPTGGKYQLSRDTISSFVKLL